MTGATARPALPPYAAMLGIGVEPVPPGEAPGSAPTLRMDFHDGLAGRPGNLHGGAIAGLLDMAAHVALRASLNGDAGFKPIGITIDYVRGGKHAPTFARGRVTRIGRRVATVIVEAWQDDPARHIAAARVHMLLKPAPAST